MIPFLYSIDLGYENFNSTYNPYVYVYPTVAQNFYMLTYNNSIQNPSIVFDRTLVDNGVNIYPTETLENVQSLRTQPVEEVNTVENRQKKQRKKNVEKQLESAKKNSQSNIVNQLYSFFSNIELSEKVVMKAIKCIKVNQNQIENLCSFFYKIVRLIIFKRGRKYVNKDNIMNFYSPEAFISEVPDIEEIVRQQGIDIEDLCSIFRISTYHLINNQSICAILSSKRISMISKFEHLKRRRRIIESLQNVQKN